MAIKSLAALIALLVGGWMIFDGVHVLRTGRYFGPAKPGLWSDAVAAVGVDPFSLGVPFIVLGLLWLASLSAVLLRRSWARHAALLTAVLTLWYLPVGTILSVLYIVLLLGFRSKMQA